MRSEEFYKRCGTTPQALHERIVLARWSLFGHVLRMGRDTPAQLAMDSYSKQKDEDRSGRPVTTLPVLLFKEHGMYKKSKREKRFTVHRSKAEMLAELRDLASDRVEWRKVTRKVCDLVIVS